MCESAIGIALQKRRKYILVGSVGDIVSPTVLQKHSNRRLISSCDIQKTNGAAAPYSI
jgi:hypothetical protein